MKTMKNEFFKKWLAAALWVLALGSTAALAEPDTFYLGDGHNGSFTAGPDSIVNSYAQLLSPLLEGDTELTVASCTPAPCFAAGDLVMVLQTTGFLGTPQVEDPATSTSLNSTEVGRWELARVDSVSGTTIKLKAPLIRGYAAQVTQVIRVPEFVDVTIGPENSIVAKPWDGKVGGVLAFLVTGNVRNQGLISAEGEGFRGGVFVSDPNGINSTGCSGDVEPAPKGAQKGEGIANTYYGPSQTGRGYVLNGGGGGVCLKSGGGGGANHGKGGMGGFSTDGSRGVGGRAGAPIRDYALLNRLIPGGGGGAGHGSAASATRGGGGGGIILIRAHSLSGGGSLLATGSSGYFSSTDAAGGGGAGGSIHLRFASTASCGDIDASGGNGGSPNTKQVGPGGGGGGGVVLLQAASGGNCSLDMGSVLGGAPGRQKDPSAPDGELYGAERGASGRVEMIERGFAMPAVPTVSAPSNGSATGNPRPNVMGTATANTTVVIYIDGKEVGRGTSNAVGNYIVALAEPLADGTHIVQAAAELDGVQSLKSTANTFTVDALTPLAPVVTVPGEGDFVSTLRPSLQGTAEADSTVTVYLDNRQPVTVTASGTGEWTYTPDFDLAQGAHTVKATATDAAGNVSPESNVRTFNVDTLVPAAPVVSTPANDSHSNNTRPLITGTAEAGTTVTVYLDGVELGTVPANAGAWSYALTSDLADKTYTVKATATDAAGNVSPESNTHTFTIDTVAPVAPVVSTPTEGSYVATPVIITGSAEAGSTVTIIIDGVPVGLATANASGEWTYTTTAVMDGPREVKVTATDLANNTSPESNTRTFIVDATAPVAPVVSTPDEGARVNTRTPVITGTAEADTTVTVYLNGSAVGTAPVDGSGNWSFTTATLVDGSYAVKVTATDAAGNVSPESNTRSFIVDATAPVAPGVSTPADEALFNTRTPVITGTAEAGTTVTVYLNGSVVGSAPVNTLGNWTFTTAELADGTYAVKATATDAAGNVSPESNTRTFHVDATASLAPVVTAPADGALLNTSTPAITGTAEAGTTVTVYLNGSAVGTVPVDGSGNWSFTTATLADGTYAVKVTATDAAGNVSPESNTRTFRVDATAPAAPVVLTPAQGTVVADSTPAITGTAEVGSTVTVLFDGKEEPVTVTADGAGNWSYTPTTALSDGPHTVTAYATDAAGNDSPVAAVHDFTVDSGSPETFIDSKPPEISQSTAAAFTFRSDESPVTYQCTLDGASLPCSASLELTVTEGAHTLTVSAVDSAGNVDPTPASYSWTVDSHSPEAPVVVAPVEGAELESSSPIVVSGTAEPDSTVTLLLDGQEFVTQADGSGHWSYTFDVLAPGPHQVTARATDAAGNVSPDSAPRSFTVLDSARMPNTELSSGPSGTTTEHDATFTFGSDTPGATFECSLDGAEFTACTSPVAYTGLADGEHTFQVRARDARGVADATPETRTWTVGEADIAYLGGGFGCSATGGDSSLVLMSLGTLLALARRRRAAL